MGGFDLTTTRQNVLAVKKTTESGADLLECLLQDGYGRGQAKQITIEALNKNCRLALKCIEYASKEEDFVLKFGLVIALLDHVKTYGNLNHF